MPRSEAQNEAIRAATREKLQAAAITLFTRKGFAATSVGDIAAAAGVSVGLLYRHYRTKEDLFGDLVEQAATGLDRVAAMFRTEEPATELILAFAAEFLGDLATGGSTLEFYLLLQQAVLRGPDDPRIAALVDRHEALRGETVRLIERGQRDGTFRAGPADTLADLFYAALGGLAQLNLIRGDRFTVPAPELLTAFLIKETS